MSIDVYKEGAVYNIEKMAEARCEMFIDEMVRMNNALNHMDSKLWHLERSSEELAREYDNL